MKIPLIVFQVVLCMHLEVHNIYIHPRILLFGHYQKACGLNFQGTPEDAKYIPVPVLFSPLFLLQVVGILLAASKLIEKVVVLVRGEDDTGLYFRVSSRAHDCLGFLHHGSR